MVATLGSKEGLANLSSAITSPGDTILVPNPSYPIHQFGFIIAGASGAQRAGSRPTRTMLRALDVGGAAFSAEADGADREFPLQSRRRIWPIWISIPSWWRSPASMRSGFSPIWPMPRSISATEVPPSILQVPGAKDIAVEFTSMSKTYSMPGWRIGFAAGNQAADQSALARG